MKKRCSWAQSEIAIRYHDEEWGTPLHNDQKLFEFLILEGAQAGLSWDTILAKRENYREAFDNFDAAKIAAFDEHKLAELINNAGIVRNRLKIASAVQNAQAYLKVCEEFDRFDRYIWQFVSNKPIKNAWRESQEIPVKTIVSDGISKDLRKRGFNFVGSTICYAFMQATGMVNDHLISCFRYEEI